MRRSLLLVLAAVFAATFDSACKVPPEAEGLWIAGLEMGLDLPIEPSDLPLTEADCELFSDAISFRIVPLDTDDSEVEQQVDFIDIVQGSLSDDEPPIAVSGHCRFRAELFGSIDGGSYEVTVEVLFVGAEPFIESCVIDTFFSEPDNTGVIGWAGFKHGIEGCVASNSLDPDYETYP